MKHKNIFEFLKEDYRSFLHGHDYWFEAWRNEADPKRRAEYLSLARWNTRGAVARGRLLDACMYGKKHARFYCGME